MRASSIFAPPLLAAGGVWLYLLGGLAAWPALVPLVGVLWMAAYPKQWPLALGPILGGAAWFLWSAAPFAPALAALLLASLGVFVALAPARQRRFESDIERDWAAHLDHWSDGPEPMQVTQDGRLL